GLDRDRNLLVADRGGHRVVKLDHSGQVLGRWGSEGSGPGQFTAPADVAADTQGNIYVADSAAGRVQKLGPDGRPLAQWDLTPSDPNGWNGPTQLAVDSQGNVYVLAGGSVQKISSTTGQVLATWGAENGSPRSQPVSLAVDARDNLYIGYTQVDFDSGHIVEISPSGQKVADFPGKSPSGLAIPSIVAPSQDGNALYILDDAPNIAHSWRTVKFSQAYNDTVSFGTVGDGANEFQRPADIVVDGEGAVYVSDREHHRIEKFSGDQAVAQWDAQTGQLGTPRKLAADKQGNVFVATDRLV